MYQPDTSKEAKAKWLEFRVLHLKRIMTHADVIERINPVTKNKEITFAYPELGFRVMVTSDEMDTLRMNEPISGKIELYIGPSRKLWEEAITLTDITAWSNK